MESAAKNSTLIEFGACQIKSRTQPGLVAEQSLRGILEKVAVPVVCERRKRTVIRK